ncbi:MAG: DUF4249 family protein [Prolixibacteraceae bacterium]|nr:DUF4249 family protein [Prolixibacteraceae bacterium]
MKVPLHSLSFRFKQKIVFCISIIILCSCTELITNSFPEYEKVPTVNALCIAGKPISINLSWTGGLDSLQLEWINNATIDLFADGTFIEQLTFIRDGLYTSNKLVEVEKEYECRIIIPGEDTIVCSQTLPAPSPVLNVEHLNIAGRNEEGYVFHGFKLTFKNDLTQTRYYEVTTSDGNFENFDDPVFLNEGLPMPLFSNKLITDSVYTLTLNYWTNYKHALYANCYLLKPYAVTLRSVTYDYYQYQKQAYIYERGKYADINSSTVPMPFHSNIDNAYGIIAGYSTCVSDSIIPEPYVEY